ncbi:hypothetical protein CDD83_3522 [Cordyceps sp. RAO-2017]|nr:hypothetical protein CDD83_3522 [Cordyceps sp. RAO-2017]
MEEAALQRQIAELSARLARLRGAAPPPAPPSPHFLLLLADSALPIGSFAFSSGLESCLAHAAAWPAFFPLSMAALASAALPFVLAAHRRPCALVALDDEADAAAVCAVARRASVAQGRALLGVWERSFAPALRDSGAASCSSSAAASATSSSSTTASATSSSSAAASATSSSSTTASAASSSSAASSASSPEAAASILAHFAALLRDSSSASAADDVPPPVAAHLAPLFGAVCAFAGLDLRQAAYVFMLSHAKALVSAAVRASVFGPYHGHRLLAGHQLRHMIDALVDREWDTPSDEAGQSVPIMDLWVGRHELLYSRIFNS